MSRRPSAASVTTPGGKPPGRPVGPSGSRDFRYVATTEAEENNFDILAERAKMDIKFTNLVGSTAHLVKGALGGGILIGHVAYMKCGNVLIALGINIGFGIYMGYCLWLLVNSAQLLYRRTRIPVMSYADVGEASCMLFHNTKVQRCAKLFRYIIDVIIVIDLFGSCTCYYIIIAKSVKQLVEDVKEASFEPAYPGYPSLRVYMAILMPVVVIICLVRHLKYLAPFSIAANFVILFSVGMAAHYAFYYNPHFEGMLGNSMIYGTFEAIGMIVFSMSCAGVVLPIENNMTTPQKFPLAITTGMSMIVVCTSSISFFGYAAFLEKCEPPITLNFPMTLMPRILKAFIAGMLYTTFGLNFWVPFNLCYYYIKKRYPPEKAIFYEYIYRAFFAVMVGVVAIVFPDINAIMGFIGCFCLSNMAFIWPNIITLLVIWKRPGFGRIYWRLWRAVILIVIGVFILICGSIVTFMELVTVFIKINLA